MVYQVATRDGTVHETRDQAQLLAWLNMFGPEVVASTPLQITRKPSKKQIALFELAIDVFKTSTAKLVGKMDDSGILWLHVNNNGHKTRARFDRKGMIVGDWF